MNRLLLAACLFTLVRVADAQSPTTADDLTARITAMAQIPSTFAPVYSRDGRRIAFLSNRTGTPQLWMIDRGGEPKQITQSIDPVGSVAWSPVDDVIAYDIARGGGFNSQIYFSRPDGSDVTRITSGGKEDNFAGSFAPDGRYYFRSNLRNPQAPDSWIYDPKVGKAAIAIEYDTLGGINDIQRPPNRALISRVVTRGNTNLALHDLDTKQEIVLTPHDGPLIAYGELAPAGSAAYIVNNLTTDKLIVSRMPIDAAGKPGEMTTFAARDDAEVDGFVVSDDGRLAVLTWNVGGRAEMEVVSLPDGKRTALPPAPGELVSVSDFSAQGDRIALNVSGSTTVPSAWEYEFATRRYTPIAPLTIDVDLASLV